MEGDARRQELLRLISKSQKPISGTELAQTLHVSRQVIVQDVALLRASKYPIFATNRGYVLLQDDTHHVTRVIRVKHNSHQIEEELNVIVDCGARVLDVTVEHEIYGIIRCRFKSGFQAGSKAVFKGFIRKPDKTTNRLNKRNSFPYH